MHASRGRRFSAAALTATTLSLIAAPAAFAQGNGGNAPPGNNGTVKIDAYVMDAGHDNDPHVTCDFSVNFYGYDGGPQQASIDIRPVAPTGSNQSFTTSTKWNTGIRTGGGQFDQTVPITISQLHSALSGVNPRAQQGYHLRLEVEVTGSHGSDDKYKTFWLAPCSNNATTSSSTGSIGNGIHSAAPSHSTVKAGTTASTTGVSSTPTAILGAATGSTAGLLAAAAASARGAVTSLSRAQAASAITPASALPASPVRSISARSVSGQSRAARGASSGSLAFTGADLEGLAGAGLGLIGFGALVVLRTRRNRTSPHRLGPEQDCHLCE